MGQNYFIPPPHCQPPFQDMKYTVCKSQHKSSKTSKKIPKSALFKIFHFNKNTFEKIPVLFQSQKTVGLYEKLLKAL